MPDSTVATVPSPQSQSQVMLDDKAKQERLAKLKRWRAEREAKKKASSTSTSGANTDTTAAAATTTTSSSSPPTETTAKQEAQVKRDQRSSTPSAPTNSGYSHSQHSEAHSYGRTNGHHSHDRGHYPHRHSDQAPPPPQLRSVTFGLKKRPLTFAGFHKAANGLSSELEVGHPTKRVRMSGLSAIHDDGKTSLKTSEPQQKVVEVDPLDAFMSGVDGEMEKLDHRVQDTDTGTSKEQSQQAPRMDESDGSAGDEEEQQVSDDDDILALAAKRLARKKDLAQTDHSQIEYPAFRKNFYIEHPDIKAMTKAEVELLRQDLGQIKIRGVHCPRPVVKWTHCGLPGKVFEVIKKLGYAKPTPIQAQGIPAIMSGRDVIGVAKTGSGKTLAFLLPMFRHIQDQPQIEIGDGPVSLIMTPTRELAMQIYRECKQFCKPLGMKIVCAYGGNPIKDQIADLKRGAEMIVCTPGRMIDLLCANSGRVTNLRRVTYLVLDEADRMFDMGFEPQVMKIVNNVRPSKQCVMFSATFPRTMEALAKKVLRRPLEVVVGGRSVVAKDVEQFVEVRDDHSKFRRLLEILGQWFEKEKDSQVLVFVDRQEAADSLLRDLIRRGYMCSNLHGGKDQMDRDSTIQDFKNGVFQVLIATSVAARGLDVKGLNLVVNFDAPNHMEDYVHRVGRTGRAGAKGTAFTFVTPDQERYAMDIRRALTASGAHVTPELQALAGKFEEKIKAGKASYGSTGFGGKGLEKFERERDAAKKVQKAMHGVEDEPEEEEEEADGDAADGVREGEASSGQGVQHGRAVPLTGAAKAQNVAAGLNARFGTGSATGGGGGEASGGASSVVAAGSASGGGAGASNNTGSSSASSHPNPLSARITQHEHGGFSLAIEINDYPQKARWKVTNKEQISLITEISGAAITTRGTYLPPHKVPKSDEKKLYLFIEGESQLSVETARKEIKRILVEATVASLEAGVGQGGGGGFYGGGIGGGGGGGGRYSVV